MKTKLTWKQLKPVLNERLARLDIPDDAPVLRRSITADSRADLDDKERTCVQVVSSNAVDSYGTIIDPEGLDLREFKTNPVVLWGHRYNEPPIGSDEDIWYEDGKVIARTQYAETPRAEEIWQLKRQGHLKAASITFVPTVTKTVRDKDWGEVLARYGIKPGDEGAPVEVYTRSILVEHSDVSIGSNPEALLVSVSRGLTLSDDMRRTLGIEDAPVETKPVADRTKEPDPAPAVKTERNITREIRNIINKRKGRLQ